MGRRRETEDVDGRRRLAEARQRAAPIRLSRERCALFPRDFLAPLDQARAQPAFDDALLERFFAEEELSVDELKAALRKATIAGKLVPILNGSALKNKGVRPLLDGQLTLVSAASHTRT